MKKISYLLLAFVVAFITSCAVTPDVQPTTVDNTLPVANGGLDISFTDATINSTNSVVAASGDNVNVSLLIKKTALGGKPRIMRVYVSDQANYRATGATPLFEIKLKNKDEQTQTIDYTVSPSSGKVYIHFDVYDNTSTSDDVTKSGINVTRKTLVVNVSTTGQIASWAGITLGGQGNSAGSRLASATGDVYKVCDLDSNMKYIDITYASNRTTDAPQLLSNPARATQGYATVVASTNTECGGTSTAGGIATIFQAAPTGTDFDGATDATLGALSITASTQSIAVATGKVYMFQRGSGSNLRKGLIRVNTITPVSNIYANGTITFDIKVQK
ncbi:MAG: hypothetical protein QE277_04885 [Flectobacillus sp.]|nr:hypothetical protein [Flectobacillus sp.]